MLKYLLRLMAVKHRRIKWHYHDCMLCKAQIYKGEKAFVVDRWAKGKKVWRTYYCERCISSRKQVLNEVDTDDIPYGIANIDDYYDFRKENDEF